jgi:guanylate kinase
MTPDFVYSVSCTTRAPRRGEEDGKDYWFMDDATFQKRVKEGYFLEHAKVHGYWYGTPVEPIKDTVARGLDVLLDIDVQGAAQIKGRSDEVIQSSLVTVFLMPPVFSELERRLRKRATDDEATIQRRLAAAREEMSHWQKYDYVILSGSVEEDLQKFRAIMKAEHYRTSRLKLSE